MYENVMERSFLISGELSLPVGWTAGAHRHPHPELILVTQGVMTAVIAGESILANAGDLLLYPAGSVHRESNAGRSRLGMIYVHARLDPVPRTRIIDRDGRLPQLVRWLAADQAAGAPAEVLAAWLEALRVQLRRCAEAGAAALADAVRATLRADLTRPHDVAGLARTAGLGPRQFLRRYRAETRTTPMADLRRLRCEAAAGLLASTDWPLERIARSVGFCDAFHLSKVFRGRYGVPPGRMRSRGVSPV